MSIKEKTPKEVKFRHGILALGALAVVMFGCVVGLGSEPQIPLVVGCAIAGGIAMYLGRTWEDVLDAILKGINDAMEAVLILMCIGMLVGVWIQSGTVPTMIYYGLMVVSPELFLPIAFLVTTAVGIVLGSWGAAGTIGIAFLGIAAALNIPLGMAAGAVVAGSYVSEIISPLVDGPNLAAAIADCGVFALCKRFLVLCLITCLGCAGIYLAIGMNLDVAGSVDVSSQVGSLLTALDANYSIGPITLIPLAVMILCIVLKVPAIPSFLAAIVVGMVEACLLQGSALSTVVEVANLGVVSNTGFAQLDALLSNGGIQEMMSTISIVVLVMAYGGIMQHTHLMDALVDPIVSRLRRMGQLIGATVFSGALFNVLLPDQYPAITLSTQMYSKEFRRRGVKNDVWANIVNSSAGITSVLVPWNTCAVYMVTVLGVECLTYMPYAFFCYLYPLVVVAIGVLFGKRIGWVPRSEPAELDDTSQVTSSDRETAVQKA
ncbi:MAG: Na+/H+ antiporter NhaC family protein [Gordonibacter sp.]|uniref:Na+/H+ antiporter NhaC family protein n=1 Tax=Gordonibacter sp. TaxID=1968902 RepID=UPI002FC94362